MSGERQLTLRQIDQVRGDMYAIADDLDFLEVQLARIPTRREMACTALAIMCGLKPLHPAYTAANL
jgi:hypothetical protein